ncbi:MAG TPA: c-type cytochrome biogenesis protein CcmI [Gammaproteobacteria bacterium]|nr:c-type cytochrome biogenesis protein CcmI [Gammaproteobacteria bacterium]
MSTFWLLIAAMTVLALVFVVPPLLRRRQEASRTDSDRLNAEVIKDQLAELRSDYEAGRLDEAAYAAARRDLQRELLDDIDDGRSAPVPGTRGGRWLAIVVVALVPVAAFLLYQQLGAPGIIERLDEWQQARAAAAGRQHSLEGLVQKLADRMRSEPDNAEGWVMLGRSYAALGHYDKAVDAYRRAYRLIGDQPGLLTDYADVLVSANGGTFTDEAGALLDKALALQPDDLKALWLRGHWKYQRGDVEGAVADWQRVASQLPEGDKNRAIIASQIREARAASGQSAAAAGNTVTDKATTSTGTAPAKIRVRVTLDPALADKATPDQTLFVFARAAQGPRMPLAIVRKQVRDLPLSVTLDDSMAMTPAMKLSNFDQVTIGARISKSGQAIAASGDLQGVVTPVKTDSGDEVTVHIDTLVP